MQHLIVWSCINSSKNHNCSTDLQHLLHCTDDCNFLRCINLELCSKTRADIQICWKEGTLNDNQLNPLRELLEATIYCHWGLWICDNFRACCSECEVMDCRCNTYAREVIHTVSCIVLPSNVEGKYCVSGLCNVGMCILIFMLQFM